MMKYTIYDDNNELIFESNDKNQLVLFITLNGSGDLLMFHKEDNIFIMYFQNYVIYSKM